MSLLIQMAVLTITVLVLARFLPGIKMKGPFSAVLVAVVFSLLNLLLGKVLLVFIGALMTLPAILTFGLLFLLVPFLVNTLLLWLSDLLIASFEITSGRTLVIASAVITLVNGVFHLRGRRW